MIHGNRGEWSEIYTLFKLLGEGKVHAGDAAMRKMDLYYPIVSVIREESKHYTYSPNTDKRVVIITENGEEISTISMKTFLQESRFLLEQLKSEQYSAAFSVPNTEKFMKQVRCENIKVPNAKADIQIVIHDLRTNMTPLLGFSIKSQLGNPSTLLNASIPTNFTMKVVGLKNEAEASEIDSFAAHLDKIQEIYNRGYYLQYDNVPNDTFRNNLLFIDGYMPAFLGSCLIEESRKGCSSDVTEVVKRVAAANPFNYTGSNVKEFYEHKMKQLLVDCALGMTPAKAWNGHYDANGGYLVVRKDGEVVCYHFYNRNEVEDYLYYNTRFERGSRSRHKYGSIFSTHNNFYINLNLQIRFKK